MCPNVEQNYFSFDDLDSERNAVAMRDTDGLNSSCLPVKACSLRLGLDGS